MKKIQTNIENKQSINTIKNEYLHIRPQTFNEYIGQNHIIKNLKIAIKAAKIKNSALDHILLYGPPGLGKTTLASVISNEMEADIKFVSGPAIEKQGELAALLATLKDGDILFIDEIHRLPKFVEEMLYSAMEDYKIDIIVGDGPQAKAITMPLEKFTLIGATTKVGMISQPLRDRFGFTFNMEYYSIEDMIKIILRSAKILNINLDYKSANMIAHASRQTPRIANNIVKRVGDYLLVNNINGDKDVILNILNEMGINKQGLNLIDVKYLKFLNDNKGNAVGLKTISAYLGETVDTITESIEPYLIRMGYVLISPKGRKTTEKCIQEVL